MTPEQRRDTIVQAALPLVAELGAAVTTAKIARAAGIGEATIFRVFDDKDSLLAAVATAAMDPTRVLQELQSIPLDQPLADRLTEALEALDAHLTRMGAVLGALRTTRPAPSSALSSGREASQRATCQAVLDLLEPDADQLRTSAESTANSFLNLFYGRGRLGHASEVPNADLVDLFLHGALARP